jgi:hypothetical protein
MKSSYVPTDPTEQAVKAQTSGYWKTTGSILLYSVTATITLSIIATINGVPPQQHGKLAKLGMGLGVVIWLAKKGLNVWHWPSHWWPKDKMKRES